jgi:hypothetical protein
MNFIKLNLLVLSSIFIIFLAGCDNSSNGENVEFRRYQVESGTIVYQLTGLEQGTETLYFKDWGNTEVHYKQSKLTILGTTAPNTHSMYLVKGDDVYNIDLNKNKGTKIIHPPKDMSVLEEKSDPEQKGEQKLNILGGKKIGTKDIAGETCDNYEMKDLDSTTCIWNNLILETTNNTEGFKQKNTAVRIDIDSDIPEQKFAIPAEITLVDMKHLLEQ